MPADPPTTPLLFTPITLRNLTLKNRIVVAPMHVYSATPGEGFPTDFHMQNYGRYASGGAGLVIVESTKVDRRGCGTVGDLGLWDDKFIEPFSKITALVKGLGAAVGLQLGHSGRKARCGRPWEGGKPLKREDCPEISDESWNAWELVAPSAIAADENSPVPRALSTEEMEDLAQAWGRAAARAAKAGFQMVEIHGAHGFFIHETLSPTANQRTDKYGGSQENRFRFALEVSEAVRKNFPAEYPVFMRLSVDDDAGWTPDDSVLLSRLLKEKGIDVVDCSGGGMTSKPVRSAPVGYNYQSHYSEKLRKEAGIMTMAVGLIVEAQQAERLLQEGRADLVALAREMLYNPNWPMDAALKMGLDGEFHRSINGCLCLIR